MPAPKWLSKTGIATRFKANPVGPPFRVINEPWRVSKAERNVFLPKNKEDYINTMLATKFPAPLAWKYNAWPTWLPPTLPRSLCYATDQSEFNGSEDIHPHSAVAKQYFHELSTKLNRHQRNEHKEETLTDFMKEYYGIAFRYYVPEARLCAIRNPWKTKVGSVPPSFFELVLRDKTRLDKIREQAWQETRKNFGLQFEGRKARNYSMAKVHYRDVVPMKFYDADGNRISKKVAMEADPDKYPKGKFTPGAGKSYVFRRWDHKRARFVPKTKGWRS